MIANQVRYIPNLFNVSTEYNRFGTSTTTTPVPTGIKVETLGVSTTTGPHDRKAMHDFRFKKLQYHSGPFRSIRYGYYSGAGYSVVSTGWTQTSATDLTDTSLRGSYESWSSLIARSIEQLLEKARGSHANVAVDLAEADATIKMLKNAVRFKKLVGEFMSDVVKGRSYRRIRGDSRRSQERRTQYISGKWLEYRYGWMPLLSSIFELADTLRKTRVGGETRLASRQSGATRSGKTTHISEFSEHRVDIGSYQFQIIGYFDLASDKGIQDFTNLNPLSIAWELVPFSFVADWFVNVSGYLEAWENYYTFRNRYLRGCYAYRLREDRIASIVKTQFSTPWFLSNGHPVDMQTGYVLNANVIAVFKALERYNMPTLPVPIRPHVKMDLKARQIADVAALIRQAMTKR